MLNWTDDDLDSHELKIISRSLELAKETVEHADSVQACIGIGFQLTLFQDFKKEFFVDLLDKLKAAHEDNHQIWYITDYHYLVLYRVLEWACGEHNISVMTDDAPKLLDSRHTIKFEDLVGRLFLDTDFLLSAEEYGSFGDDERDALGMSSELFSITNGLVPHPDELKMVPKPWKRKRRGHTL